MSPPVTYVLLFFMGMYGLILLVDLVILHRVRGFLVETALLLTFTFSLRLTVDFPHTKQSFGGASPATAMAIMFICTLLGVIGHYFFYLESTFSWGALLKPLCISPIVLLPLLGSVQGTSAFEPVQLVSFGILSFQNGFFWEVVLERAKTKA